MSNLLARTFQIELRRVSAEEDVSMADVMASLEALTGYSARQLYNFRNGKWPLPPEIVPVLCRRFKSNEMGVALAVERPNEDEVSGFDIEQEAVDLLRLECQHHCDLIEALNGQGDPKEMDRFASTIEEICRRERRLLAALEAVRVGRRAKRA